MKEYIQSLLLINFTKISSKLNRIVKLDVSHIGLPMHEKLLSQYITLLYTADVVVAWLLTSVAPNTHSYALPYISAPTRTLPDKNVSKLRPIFSH